MMKHSLDPMPFAAWTRWISNVSVHAKQFTFAWKNWRTPRHGDNGVPPTTGYLDIAINNFTCHRELGFHLFHYVGPPLASSLKVALLEPHQSTMGCARHPFVGASRAGGVA